MIHILTLTWNGLDRLKKLKPSLEKAVTPLGQPVKWYIRDNGSIDGTVEWLESYRSNWVDMEPMYVDHNRDNFAKGVNSLYWVAHQAIADACEFTKSRSLGLTTMAAVAASNDYILLLNNDIEFADQTSLVYMLALMKDPQVGAVGARLLYSGTNKLQHAGLIFGPKYGHMPFHYRWKEESDEHSEKNRYFQAVTAACCLIRVRDFVELDCGFNWAFEDVDLMLRIGKKKKIAYCGQTKIYHEESASLKKNPVNNLFLNQNVSRWKDKWFGKYQLDHDKYLKRSSYRIIK